ncbi:MAG: PAS domain-containing protein [Actinomycetota bacterium]|nr:PAS domain-containing protein [Actinomycetota bacterium]
MSDGKAGQGDGKVTGDSPQFEALLDFLKHSRSFDFTGYKRSTLVRRVSTRMALVGVDDFGAYLDVLQVDPQEFTQLFDVLLINATAFFRDPPAWDYLAAEVVPKLLARKPAGEPVRVWSAGCASGEEAYSLAMLVAEQVGPELMPERVKIYGTDLDEDALATARQGSYPAKAVSGVPDELLDRYFETSGGRYTVRKDLRRTVIFGRHDLVQAAPISHIDLLVCRNTLIYLNAETQARVLNRLHFALEEGGILFLGKAEMLLTHRNLFVPVDLKRRFFVKVTKDSLRDRLSVITEGGSHDAEEYPVNYRPMREASADAAPVAQIGVHHSGTVAMANAAARRTFGVSLGDVGRPFQDLEVSYRPAELRSFVAQALADRRPVVLEAVPWPDGPHEANCFNIHLTPLFDRGGDAIGVTISFIDVTLTHRLQEGLEASNRELETAYEELQATNEELETTNEELQSTIEELETTNEELQSTNEELETMNAELHSTNEELQTINDELRLRSGEIDELNEVLESILVSQRGGVVVLDRDLRVTLWNHRSADLWGLRPEEVPGQHFLNLDIGLPTEDLRAGIRAVLAGESDDEAVSLAATNRRGKDFRCRVTMAPLLSRQQEVRGVILLMQDEAGPD